MNLFTRKNLLLCSIILAVVLLTVIINYRYSKIKHVNSTTQQTINRLPDDVENVVEGYHYSEIGDDARITVSGKRIIRRGRQILGLRSNLVKTNFFEDVQGTLQMKKGTLSFSASDAEWSAIVTQPFILKKDVTVSVNGKPLHDVKSARLYFKQGLLEVNTDRIETYQLK